MQSRTEKRSFHHFPSGLQSSMKHPKIRFLSTGGRKATQNNHNSRSTGKKETEKQL
jgi:hypothetical protein